MGWLSAEEKEIEKRVQEIYAEQLAKKRAEQDKAPKGFFDKAGKKISEYAAYFFLIALLAIILGPFLLTALHGHIGSSIGKFLKPIADKIYGAVLKPIGIDFVHSALAKQLLIGLGSAALTMKGTSILIRKLKEQKEKDKIREKLMADRAKSPEKKEESSTIPNEEGQTRSSVERSYTQDLTSSENPVIEILRENKEENTETEPAKKVVAAEPEPAEKAAEPKTAIAEPEATNSETDPRSLVPPVNPMPPAVLTTPNSDTVPVIEESEPLTETKPPVPLVSDGIPETVEPLSVLPSHPTDPVKTEADTPEARSLVARGLGAVKTMAALVYSFTAFGENSTDPEPEDDDNHHPHGPDNV